MPDPRNRLPWQATCKVYPAICDIQAPDDTIRVMETFTCIANGNQERLLYECPAGKCAMIQYGYAYSVHGNPVRLYFIIKVAADVFYLSRFAHAAGDEHFIHPGVLLKAGDFFGTIWTSAIIGNNLSGTVIGYEMLQY